MLSSKQFSLSSVDISFSPVTHMAPAMKAMQAMKAGSGAMLATAAFSAVAEPD